MKAVLETIAPNNAHSFDFITYALPRFNCPYHYHPEIELTAILAGDGHRLVGDNLTTFSNKDIVLLGPNLPHIYFCPPDFDAGPVGAAACVIRFDPALMLNGSLMTAPEFGAIRRLLKHSARGLSLPSVSASHILPKMLALRDADPVHRLLLLLDLLNEIATLPRLEPLASRTYKPMVDDVQSRRMEKICAIINEEFTHNLSIGSVAKRVHLSSAAFCRFFNKATGRTFVQFVNEMRIGHACRLLMETDATIAEIAFASGFENLANFNRRFQQFRKCAPREFRNKISASLNG
ncbi:MAG: AraC family transcriptional regulator [Verrucomicrobiota bacterium]|nr:AraC family transcriptional regulator [Verrucomicrobiota bacterium]